VEAAFRIKDTLNSVDPCQLFSACTQSRLQRRAAEQLSVSDSSYPKFKIDIPKPSDDPMIYLASTWVLPVLLAITLHEAAHGFVAHHFGDDTAWQLGRVSLNPLRHIDPFGTLFLPALLLLTHAPFLFGYAKPVPVNFGQLRNPRCDMIWVAAAGPVMNLALATVAALLLHTVDFLPVGIAQWVLRNLVNAIGINVILAVFNLIPLPPLDGGRVAVGILPDVLAAPLARLAPYGMWIVIGALFLLPILAAQVGVDVNVFNQVITRPVAAIISIILLLTGAG
jgi:Zn-dependent protease